MAIEIRKREGESIGSLLYRFSKKIQHSGVIKEAKKRRFSRRVPNRRKVRLSAIYRSGKTAEIKKNFRQGRGF